ncbi:hypothetical protein [Mesorhizobium onobrychidis]|nr:hypothetical protein [Mesorhizobium onobrychidis]
MALAVGDEVPDLERAGAG